MSLLAAAGLGAAAGLAGAGANALVQGLAGRKQKKMQREMLEEDIGRMQRGELGLSDAERRTMQAEANEAAEAALADTADTVKRVGSASGGFGRSGAVGGALQGLGRAGAETAAQTARGINQMSTQKAQQEKRDIDARLGGLIARKQGTAANIGSALQTGISQAIPMAQSAMAQSAKSLTGDPAILDAAGSPNR